MPSYIRAVNCNIFANRMGCGQMARMMICIQLWNRNTMKRMANRHKSNYSCKHRRSLKCRSKPQLLSSMSPCHNSLKILFYRELRRVRALFTRAQKWTLLLLTFSVATALYQRCRFSKHWNVSKFKMIFHHRRMQYNL